MPRPRKYIRDEANKTIDGLSVNASTGVYYSITPEGQRVYFGSDKQQAIKRYLATKTPPVDKQNPEPFAALPDDERQRRMVKRREAKQRFEPVTVANPKGLRTLVEARDRWREDKQGEIKNQSVTAAVNSFNMFIDFAKKRSITDLSEVNKELVRKFRAKTKKDAIGLKDTGRHGHYRHIKQVINHVLIECDIYGVNEHLAAYLQTTFKMLKTKTAKAHTNIYIEKDELHGLLKACDYERTKPRPNEDAVRNHLAKCKICDTKTQTKCDKHQSIAAEIGSYNVDVYLATEMKAIYLTALNLMYPPECVSTVPRTAVNFSNGHVVFRRDKKKISRAGLLLPVTMKAIQDWLAIRTDSSPLLFINSDGGAWDSDSLNGRLRYHGAIAKERFNTSIRDEVTFISFRKGGTNAALKGEGVEEYEVKLMGGWSRGIIEHYSDAYAGRLKAAIASIAKEYGLE